MVAAALLLGVAGCAKFGAANIQSRPPGAEVINLEDDSILGRTPVKVWWTSDSSDPKYINVRFQKPGYRDKVTAFWVNMRHGSQDEALENASPVLVEMEEETRK
jgi:hypothetical protein